MTRDKRQGARQKAKGKSQKAKVGKILLIFALCLLPFDFPFVERSADLLAFGRSATFSPNPETNAEKHRSALPAAQSTAQGRRTFISHCAICHGLDGRGGEHAPDIASNPRAQRLPETRLFEIIQNGIPAGGMPSFSSLGKSGIQDVLGYLRVLQGNRRAQPVPGNPVHGRALFFGKAGCSECHMMNGQGGFLGPDLSDYAMSHSLPEIREAILEPNKNLSPQQDAVVVVTRDGRKYTGVARNEDNFSLQLQTPDGAFHLFMKSDLAVLRHEARSLMPSDYGEKLTPEQLNDLIGFLVKASKVKR